MRAILPALALLMVAPPAATDPLPGPIPAEYVGCYDGDTCTVRCHIWPGHVVTTAVRLAGVDTPEIRGGCAREKRLAREASDAARRWMRQSETIELHDVREGKYAGRVVARVTVDGRSLSDLLIDAGLGRPYDGGTRAGWCD